MSSKMQILMLKLFLLAAVCVRLGSTKNVSNMKEELTTSLPISEGQKEYIRDSVCTGDLLFLKQGGSIERCKENFHWQMDWDRSGLTMRCRSQTYVTLEVHAQNKDQLVLIVPHPNDNYRYSVEQYIVNKNKKYAIMNPDEDTNYMIYSSVLTDGGFPLIWHWEGRIHSWEEVESKSYDVQVDVERIDINVTKGIFSWKRMGDLDACFKLDVKCSKQKLRTKAIEPHSPSSIEVLNLPSDDICKGSVAGMYGVTKFNFDTYNAKPTLPKDMAAENLKVSIVEPVPDLHLYSEEIGGNWTVHAWWPKPHQLPDRYNVTLLTNRSDVTTIVLPGNATKAAFHDVLGTENEVYNLSIFSIIGDDYAHFNKRAYFQRQSLLSAWRWALAAAGAWAAAALAAVLYLRVRSYQPHIVFYTKHKAPIESKPVDTTRVEAARVEPLVPDAWEIKIERLLLHEVIGEGAFGVVRRGTLAPLGKEVAVKMLKDFPSMEEMRAFRVEMELMKSVGAHPHVVSLVGCCTARHPAIVAEYCSRGDLLNFLRCSWDVMVSKRNANYYNNNINIAEYRNDLFSCKSSEHSRLVVNKVYDLQGVCDTELTPLDLLSFCRQIAMGMEFLALNKVVHRDLAARNILVTGDRTLKIADFGLSRDVYEENQYKQKGNGKMPVKWMALESLTRRIYTTQSDVWSFGVVVWEVVTVGGAPYAGVAAARLPRLLRAGYRMPKPPNCTHHLYELMLSCWAARPRERPTFAELHARLDELLKTASADEYLSLELDDEPPPASKAYRYFRMLIKSKRIWSRGGSYERPLKAPRNYYSSPPVIYKNPA